MSITDELRKWGYGFCGDTHDVVTAIADRIDAEHESACAEAYGNGVMSVPIALDESQWVKLPVDADGVPIRVGDAVTCGATVWTVTGLKFLGEGWGICCTVYNEYGGSGTSVYPPSDLRHHHEPTVEDVLRECCHKYHSLLIDDMNDAINGVERDYIAPDEIIAEFAAKLRLAEEDA